MIKLVKSVVIVIVFLFIVIGCNKYSEVVPFFDGLYLEYKSGNSINLFTVTILEENGYEMKKITKARGTEIIMGKYTVDVHGIVKESSFKKSVGRFSWVWLPVHELKEGETINKGKGIVKGETTWKKWEALKVEYPEYDQIRYFDLNTGFWLGMEKSSNKELLDLLINTNAEIPEIP